MTMIWDGAARVFFGLGPPAVPSRMRREGANEGKDPKDTMELNGTAASCSRSSRRLTAGIVSPLSLLSLGSLRRRRRLGGVVGCLARRRRPCLAVQECPRGVRLRGGNHRSQFLTQPRQLARQEPQLSLDIVLVLPLAHLRE